MREHLFRYVCEIKNKLLDFFFKCMRNRFGNSQQSVSKNIVIFSMANRNDRSVWDILQFHLIYYKDRGKDGKNLMRGGEVEDDVRIYSYLAYPIRLGSFSFTVHLEILSSFVLILFIVYIIDIWRCCVELSAVTKIIFFL